MQLVMTDWEISERLRILIRKMAHSKLDYTELVEFRTLQKVRVFRMLPPVLREAKRHD